MDATALTPDSALHFGLLFLLISTIAFAFLKHRLPELHSLRTIVGMLNDRGGNILVLVLLSTWFFSTAVQMFYWALNKMSAKTLLPENAILLMGFQFVCGVAFGGAFGALLKSMTGSDSSSRTVDLRPPTLAPTNPASAAIVPPKIP
jgi:hypothetical protein